jgi:hypothetical protein
MIHISTCWGDTEIVAGTYEVPTDPQYMTLPMYDDPMTFSGVPNLSVNICPDGWSKSDYIIFNDSPANDAEYYKSVEVCESNGLIRLPAEVKKIEWTDVTEEVFDIKAAFEELSQIRKRIDALIDEIKKWRQQ